MTPHTIYLIAVLAAAIVLLVVLISSRTHVHPFLALFVVAALTALVAGEPVAGIPKTLARGAGGILGHTGVVIALGAVLGKLLADSGAIMRIADIVVHHSTPKTAPWLMAAVAFVIGIPMFFEVGLVILLPVIYTVAVQLEQVHHWPKMWYLRMLIPAIAALSCLHGMVPPHPGPLIAVDGLHADVGLTIMLGLICAVPTVIVAGPLYARFITPRVPLEPPMELIKAYTDMRPGTATPPTSAAESTARGHVPTWLAFACMLVPVVLMLVDSVAQISVPKSAFMPVAKAIGNPIVAMLLGVIFAALALGYTAKMTGKEIHKSFASSLGPIAGIVFIIAGGGAFNAVLKDSGIGQAIVTALSNVDMNLIVLGWLVGVLLSFATGSATVGIVSATGIVAPLVSGAAPTMVSLIVIAIGAGSIGFNWVNHAGFWFVKEAFGMTLGEATKTHMTVQTIVSVMGLLCALVLSVLV